MVPTSSDDQHEYEVWDLEPTDPTAFERLEAEQLGSKRKFWFTLRGEPQPWLFKYARANTGEHWSEKIAAEIALEVGLSAARVELARFKGAMGVACASFVPHGYDQRTEHRTKQGDLIHGNEVLAGWVTGYDKSRTFRQADHTWANICKAIQARFPGDAAHPQLVRLGGLIVFDALIGNVDRHHENWALLLIHQKDRGEPVVGISPSYDHASSLGRELEDTRRAELMRENRVGQYVGKGHGGIFWQPEDKRAPSPLALLQMVANQTPAIVKPWLDTLRAADQDRMMRPIDRVPGQCMSAVQKDFCRAFVRYTLNQLRNIAL